MTASMVRVETATASARTPSASSPNTVTPAAIAQATKGG